MLSLEAFSRTCFMGSAVCMKLFTPTKYLLRCVPRKIHASAMNTIVCCQLWYFLNPTQLQLFPFTGIGNPRGNENPMLLSMQVLWFRNHNYHADRLIKLFRDNNARYNDEIIYNRARQWNIGEHQVSDCGRPSTTPPPPPPLTCPPQSGKKSVGTKVHCTMCLHDVSHSLIWSRSSPPPPPPRVSRYFRAMRMCAGMRVLNEFLAMLPLLPEHSTGGLYSGALKLTFETASHYLFFRARARARVCVFCSCLTGLL